MSGAIACVTGGVTGGGPGELDGVLLRVAGLLAARGWRLAGAVQLTPEEQGATRCDMDLRVLPDGGLHRISLDLGAGSEGCRLDAGALEGAVAEVAAAMAQDRPDLLIVNKFGKMEAEGRGFRGLIAAAAMEGLPVLIGVNAGFLPALETFLGGPAVRLAPDEAAILGWVEGRGGKG